MIVCANYVDDIICYTWGVFRWNSLTYYYRCLVKQVTYPTAAIYKVANDPWYNLVLQGRIKPV